MRKFLFFFFSYSFFVPLHAQTFVLSGKISDKSEALPFATILVKGTTYATNSNVNGYYTLRLPPGSYEIIYQYIGFTRKAEHVELTGDKKLNVTLVSEGISLKEVEIKAGEDPSYPIIRKAIKKRKYYLNQLDAYTCKAYIKGLQKINSLPKNIGKLIKFAGGEKSDTMGIKGVVYLSESESKYHYRKPDDQKEIMYSSKVSGDNKAFSFNQLSDMKTNFYDNLIELGDLSERPFISPIHENAFFFYRYFLLGTITSEGKTINKIKVVPKRKSDPCFRGIIYVQDSTWRLTSLDLAVGKEAKINFVDTLHLKQLHAPVLNDSVWMPVTLNLSFDFKIIGFKGSGYFNASLKEYDLNPAFPKKFFNNEVFVVEEGANKKDSAYWEANRSVPLTQEEVLDYHKKDSVAAVESTDRFKDSVDHNRNRFRVSKLFMGYTYTNTRRKFNVSLPGIITNGVQYNTVEGLNLSYRFNMRKTFDNRQEYSVTGRSRYGFSNKLWGGDLGFSYLLKPERFRRFSVQAKSIVEQFNPQNPIDPLVNTAYTLLMNRNYIKLYKESGGELRYDEEITNGLFMYTNLKYMQRDPLKNSTDQLFIDNKNLKFTSNDPLHETTEDSAFKSNRALTIDLAFSIFFKQKYTSYPHQKYILGSKYPRLDVLYRRAIPVLGANAEFDVLRVGVSDDEVKLGLLGDFSYRIKGGMFFDTRRMYFMDYKHFLGNQTLVNTNDYLQSFKLLPYYNASTNKWFAEAHAEHNFNGLFINALPLIRKLNATEVIGGHVLSTDKQSYYAELNFGLAKIFKVLRVDYVLGYSPTAKFKQGVTFGLDLLF